MWGALPRLGVEGITCRPVAVTLLREAGGRMKGNRAILPPPVSDPIGRHTEIRWASLCQSDNPRPKDETGCLLLPQDLGVLLVMDSMAGHLSVGV